MKSRFLYAALALPLLGLAVFTLSQDASARDVVLPAGTLLQCTLNEPNFSSATVDVGDPVLCHLRGITNFGQQAFPRGSYLVGHLEAAKDPGHFWGKGSLKLQFDRIGLPSGDLPLEEYTAHLNNLTAAEAEVTRLETLIAEATKERRDWLLNNPPKPSDGSSA